MPKILRPSILRHLGRLRRKRCGVERASDQGGIAAAGKKIYEEGVPDSNIPPCASCHGPQAKGKGEFPRLAGQLYDYIVKKLTNWSKERGQRPEKPDTSAIMEPIAHALTERQIKAVAAYVSYLD